MAKFCYDKRPHFLSEAVLSAAIKKLTDYEEGLSALPEAHSAARAEACPEARLAAYPEARLAALSLA
ncbi:MAG: hypothetical protein FWF91_03105 [Coriobacteriia bacterium]|nr:hypothetical protein [Coriobacteriia bacterium]